MTCVPLQSVDAGREDEGDRLVAFVEVGACTADDVVADGVAAGVDRCGGGGERSSHLIF